MKGVVHDPVHKHLCGNEKFPDDRVKKSSYSFEIKAFMFGFCQEINYNNFLVIEFFSTYYNYKLLALDKKCNRNYDL